MGINPTNNHKKFDWEEFDAAIKFLKNGICILKFRDVIKAASGCKILPFDEESAHLMNAIDACIKNNLSSLSDRIYENFKGRSNELGNRVEAELNEMLNQIPGIKCEKPRLDNGKKQAAGYPDCLIESGNIKIYADVKTFQRKTFDSRLRSFFYQPTNKNKIHFDAPHCILGFETESIGGDNRSPFKIVGYKIISLYSLQVNFKAEFNADNAELYALDSPNSLTS